MTIKEKLQKEIEELIEGFKRFKYSLIETYLQDANELIIKKYQIEAIEKRDAEILEMIDEMPIIRFGKNKDVDYIEKNKLKSKIKGDR